MEHDWRGPVSSITSGRLLLVQHTIIWDIPPQKQCNRRKIGPNSHFMKTLRLNLGGYSALRHTLPAKSLPLRI